MTRDPIHRRAFLLASAAGLALPSMAPGQSTDVPVEGGIGGTGIVGILTDFGSLIVAGAYVQTDSQTRYSDAFGPLDKSALSLGHSLTVEAKFVNGALTARRVHITWPLVGRVGEVAATGRSIVVNGVRINLTGSGMRAETGDRVSVAGLWTGRSVSASAVFPARSDTDLISGTVDRAGGQVAVGGVPLQGRGLNRLRSGSFASVLGRWDTEATIFAASKVIPDRFTGAAGPLRRLAVEGFLEPANIAPGFRIAGLGHSFKRSLKLSGFQEKRVLFTGNYTGVFDADRAVVLPRNANSRRQFLRSSSQNLQTR